MLEAANTRRQICNWAEFATSTVHLEAPSWRLAHSRDTRKLCCILLCILLCSFLLCSSVCGRPEGAKAKAEAGKRWLLCCCCEIIYSFITCVCRPSSSGVLCRFGAAQLGPKAERICSRFPLAQSSDSISSQPASRTQGQEQHVVVPPPPSTTRP